jgi:hypothetical protein
MASAKTCKKQLYRQVEGPIWVLVVAREVLG